MTLRNLVCLALTWNGKLSLWRSSTSAYLVNKKIRNDTQVVGLFSLSLIDRIDQSCKEPEAGVPTILDLPKTTAVEPAT